MPTCTKCGKSFKNFVVVDGKERNLQRRKFCLECSPFGLHNTRDLNKEKPIRLSKKVSYVREKRHRMKDRAVEYGGGKCIICGYDRCKRALEFHHLNPNTKLMNLSATRISSSAWEKTKAEIDKCILVCSNCHKEIESGLITYP